MGDQPKYVQLQHQDGHYALVLMDADQRPVGHGYRGPTLKRAQADLKYWIREKGLEELPEVRPS
jgi:hypothetical protein